MSETREELADRAAVLDQAEAAWQRFQVSLGGLTQEDFERPGVEGVWSLKDTLAHLNGWLAEAGACLEGYITGAPFPTGYDLDAFNAQSVALRVNADPVAVIDELRELFAAWVRTVRRIPHDRFTIRLTHHWTIRAMIHHFEEHGGAVERAHALARSAN